MRRYLFLFALVLIFASCLNELKLRQCDLWDHVNYGRIIVATNGLPDTEPLLPLATNDAFTNPAWGSQVLMAMCIDSPSLGLAGMQTAHGLSVLLCIAIVGFAVRRISGSAAFATVASLIYLYVNWQQFLVVRPQTLGLLFYTGLFTALNLKLDRRRPYQLLIVLSFVVWANLHGSFTMGLFLIGIAGIGRLIDFAWRCRRVANTSPNTNQQLPLKTTWQITHDLLIRSGFFRLLILGISCALAVLVNPYGINVYEEVLRVGSHPNMQNMNEWKPLSLPMKQGQAAAWAFGLFLCCSALSRRRLHMQNVLLLLLLGSLMLWSSRMINWWAPIVSYLIGVHAVSALRRFRFGSRTQQISCHFVFADAACTLVAILIIFSISPLGQQTIGRSIAETTLLENRTPLKLAAFMASDSNANQAQPNADHSLLQSTVFCPAEWTGYLMSKTRRTDDTTKSAAQKSLFPLRPMVSTHVHVIPPTVWQDFIRMHFGQSNSVAILQRYQIDTVIIDSTRQQKLANLIETTKQFQMIYKDATGQVWRRNNTLANN